MKSDVAWPLSLALLRDAVDLTPLEALFCARALHVLLRKSVSKTERTQKSHAVLAESDWIGMRDALLALAWTFSARVAMGATGADDAPPRAVLTQVALAVSVLACKMESWDAPGVAVDLARYFSRPPDAAPPSVLALVASRGGGVVAPANADGAATTVQLTRDGAAVVPSPASSPSSTYSPSSPRSARRKTSPSTPRAARRCRSASAPPPRPSSTRRSRRSPTTQTCAPIRTRARCSCARSRRGRRSNPAPRARVPLRRSRRR